jgi:acetoin utilization protein AcuB
MKAKNHMSRKVISIPPWESLGKAKALMRSGNFRHLPVVDEGKLVGILSDADIRWYGHLDATIDQAMTPNPLTIESTATLEQAARLMLDRKINALPVLADKKLIGIISTSDIVAAFLAVAKSNEMAELLRRPIGHGHMDF